MLRQIVCRILLFSLLLAGCSSQSKPETRYTFYVVDQDNKPIQAARVEVSWVGSNRPPDSARTDQYGKVTAQIVMGSAPPGWSNDLIVFVDAQDFDYVTSDFIHNTQTLTLTLHENEHLEHTIQVPRQKP